MHAYTLTVRETTERTVTVYASSRRHARTSRPAQWLDDGSTRVVVDWSVEDVVGPQDDATLTDEMQAWRDRKDRDSCV